MKNIRSGVGFGLVGLAVVVGIVLITAHHSSVKPTTQADNTASTTPVATNSVSIGNYMFMPMAITVKVGTTVTWTNTDSVAHTVTVDSGDGPSSALFGKNATYTYTFQKAGTYTYRCNVHPQMHGTVVVTG